MNLATAVSDNKKGNQPVNLTDLIGSVMRSGGFDVTIVNGEKGVVVTGIKGDKKIEYLITPDAVFGPKPESDGRTTAVEENVAEDLFALDGFNYDPQQGAYVRTD